MSEIKAYSQEDAQWLCQACGQALTPRSVVIAYLGSEFSVEMLCCPDCGMALVSQDLALGRMLEVERLLEDK